MCENVSVMGEKVVSCLEQHMRSHNRATEATQEISGAFRIGLQKVMQLRQEADNLKKMVRDLKLAEDGLDARYCIYVGRVGVQHIMYVCTYDYYVCM